MVFEKSASITGPPSRISFSFEIFFLFPDVQKFFGQQIIQMYNHDLT